MSYSKQELMAIFGISLPTVRQTLVAIGVPTKPTRISVEQAKYFSFARWLLEVEGKGMDEICQIFKSEVQLDNAFSVKDIAKEISRAKTGLTVLGLASEFGLSESTVRRTLESIGLEKHRFFGPEDVARFAQARHTSSNKSLADSNSETTDRKSRNRGSSRSKKQLAQQFGLSLLTVRRTLEAAGISTAKQRYSELEVQRFQLARKLIGQGWEYRQVAEQLQADILSTKAI
ncbi:MAG: hypothetical protein AAF974_12715 [Cyanobacteria bacterium P01_E01_bin.34]